ncbi:5,10-methylenetetrahydrofolate reductase (NAD(P)) [Alkalispirillum mobile]|uniref:Methylenetetrahydrofolate reductase n=2 Tax=Alkalispirillum mobile TaxID=85925 RepID=A0A498BTW5_9GAMM|nr:5,10-methylenetetrahydrofolate reductase (NAD(P)) [Alkalispirillum mobile]
MVKTDNMESQKQHTPVYSCEFFPPRTERGVEKLRTTRERLAQLNPAYFSVTFGAGGSTRDRTFETVTEIHRSGLEAAPHISCIGSTRESIAELLHNYREQGIRRIVALRGDMPSGTRDVGEFRYANELVAFIREETGDHFKIEVACYPEFHPQARDAEADLDNFARKVEAGADAAITQYFYNADAYFHFVEQAEQRGVTVPIVPGIMPIINFKQLARFSDACGAEIPRWLRKRLEACGDDKVAIQALGHQVVADLCRRLLDGGAPGVHFYSMNQAGPVERLWADLDLPR